MEACRITTGLGCRTCCSLTVIFAGPAPNFRLYINARQVEGVLISRGWPLDAPALVFTSCSFSSYSEGWASGLGAFFSWKTWALGVQVVALGFRGGLVAKLSPKVAPRTRYPNTLIRQCAKHVLTQFLSPRARTPSVQSRTLAAAGPRSASMVGGPCRGAKHTS